MINIPVIPHYWNLVLEGLKNWIKTFLERKVCYGFIIFFFLFFLLNFTQLHWNPPPSFFHTFTPFTIRAYSFYNTGLLLLQYGFTHFTIRAYSFYNTGLLLLQYGFTPFTIRVYSFYITNKNTVSFVHYIVTTWSIILRTLMVKSHTSIRFEYFYLL